MLDTNSIMVLVVVTAAMGLFITEKLRVDLIALCVLITLVVFGLIDSSQTLYGFANPATATVAAMFILSNGLVRTGLIDWLSRYIDKLAGKTESRLIIVLCTTIAFISAFVINTASVTVFIPVAITLAKARKIPVSRVLIPLSYASQFGGVCTLIGTSTNILINAIAVNNGLERFTLFEFAPLGLVMGIAGILYLIMIRWLLPKRKGEEQQVDKYHLADYLAELQVSKKSSLIGGPWEKSKANIDEKVNLIKFIRNENETARPRKTIIREGDVLLLHGNMDKLISMQEKYGLELHARNKIDDRQISSQDVKLVEVLIPPRSRLVGMTLQTFEFFRRYGSVVLALQRRDRIIRERVAETTLQDGDTLLLEVDEEDLTPLLKSPNLIVTNELTNLYIRKDRAFTALFMLIAVITLSVLNIVPILVAALIGAAGMVMGKCITIDEAYNSIDWKIVFLLGGILPLGLALEQSGAAVWLASSVMAPFETFGPIVVLAAIYLITAIATEFISNNAAAVIIAPISLSIASSLGVDPKPFLVAITFAASTSFATPIGYQTNTMIYAPGGYRFLDFTRVGAPLNLIFWGLAVLLIPMIWPF